MIRAILISLLLSASAFGQFGFGVKGGAPLGDAVSVTEDPLSLVTSGRSDYVIGPYVELRLPFHLAIELDALTSTVNWQQTTDLFNSQTTARAWTFPLLAKYRFGHGGLLSPYVMAGASFGKLTSISQVTNFVTGTSTSTRYSGVVIEHRQYRLYLRRRPGIQVRLPARGARDPLHPLGYE